MSRTLTFSIVSWMVLTPLALFAQQPAAQPRPQAPNTRVQRLSPQLEKHLQAWYKATSRIKTLEGEHQRWEYDLVFSVEKRGCREVLLRKPGQGTHRSGIDENHPGHGLPKKRQSRKTFCHSVR